MLFRTNTRLLQAGMTRCVALDSIAIVVAAAAYDILG